MLKLPRWLSLPRKHKKEAGPQALLEVCPLQFRKQASHKAHLLSIVYCLLYCILSIVLSIVMCAVAID